MTPAQRAEIEVMPKIGGDHRETGKPAFGSLGLLDDRQTVAQGSTGFLSASSHPNAGQRADQPAHQRTFFQNNVRSEQHVRLQRDLFSGRVDIAVLERRGYAIS